MLQPNNPVIIDSISIITDTQDSVLELSAPSTGVGGPYTVTLTMSDGNPLDTVTEPPISVTVVAGTNTLEPYYETIPTITTTAGQSVTVTPPSYVPSGTTAYYGYDPGTPSDGSLTIPSDSFNNSTGEFTVTPAAGFAGLSEVYLGVINYYDTSPNWDTQVVPVLVTPTAPTSLTLTSPSVSGVTADQQFVEFQVNGVFSGLTVTLYCDGSSTPIGSVTAPATASSYSSTVSVSITANSSTTLTDGRTRSRPCRPIRPATSASPSTTATTTIPRPCRVLCRRP